MRIQQGDLIVTSRSNRLPERKGERSGCIEVTHGCHLREDHLDKGLPPWEARRIVAEARIRAVQRQMARNGEPVFTGESGLLARGLSTWWDNPDVSVRRPQRSSQPVLLKAVERGDLSVPSVKVRQVAAGPPYEDLVVEQWGDLCVALPGLTLVDLCRHSHPLQAFYGVASLVSDLARFDRFTFAESQRRVRRVQCSLSEELSTYRGVKGVRRARTLVDAAVVGFDSPAEAVVAWLLIVMLPPGVAVVSQLPVQTPSGLVFIDVALPDHNIALEISGVGKFGEHFQVRERVNDFLDRQQRLLDAGWLSVNVQAAETLNLLELARSLYTRLHPHGVPVDEPRGPLWQEQTPELYHRDRRC